jgi:hypothetical protein
MKFMAHERRSVSLKHSRQIGSGSTGLPLLDHVEDGLVFVQPHVVVRYRHRLKGYRFGIFEKRVGPPHVLQPVHLQQSVLRGHVLGEPQPVVLPSLREENIRGVGHRPLVDAVQPHDRHVKVDYRGVAVFLRRSHFVVLAGVFREDVVDGQSGAKNEEVITDRSVRKRKPTLVLHARVPLFPRIARDNNLEDRGWKWQKISYWGVIDQGCTVKVDHYLVHAVEVK